MRQQFSTCIAILTRCAVPDPDSDPVYSIDERITVVGQMIYFAHKCCPMCLTNVLRIAVT